MADKVMVLVNTVKKRTEEQLASSAAILQVRPQNQRADAGETKALRVSPSQRAACAVAISQYALRMAVDA
jgi:hypothetical protein